MRTASQNHKHGYPRKTPSRLDIDAPGRDTAPPTICSADDDADDVDIDDCHGVEEDEK